jgi:hypothetical protein
MDLAFPLGDLKVAATRFFERYLNLLVGEREHISILFIDNDLPTWFMEGIHSCKGTRWVVVDAGSICSQRDVLLSLWNPEARYVSVHDYVTKTFFPLHATAVRFAEVANSIDYTSFEFPRFDLSAQQIAVLLARYVVGDPCIQERLADAFYRLLADDPSYKIEILSGPSFEHSLIVRGPLPWMDLAGPLVEGNVRFAPGAELFYHGTAVSGTLWCSGGINLLPLRHPETDVDLCRRLIALGRELDADPVLLAIRDGRVSDLSSVGSLGEQLKESFAVDEGFSHIVEVGIGLGENCAPLISDWAATSNEAVPGIHVGIGADPANTRRFRTRVHMDFVCPDVKIIVNGHAWFDSGKFIGI